MAECAFQVATLCVYMHAVPQPPPPGAAVRTVTIAGIATMARVKISDTSRRGEKLDIRHSSDGL